MPDAEGRIRPISPPCRHEDEKQRADLAEHKLEAIRQRALTTPITEDTADLRGYTLGMTGHKNTT